MEYKVLIVEDDDSARICLCDMLRLESYDVSSVATGAEAVEFLETSHPHIVLTDLKLPDMSGIDVISAVKKTLPNTICMVITGYATVETAVEAMKAGAFSYLKKPFRRDELLVALAKAKEVLAIQSENASLRQRLRSQREQFILGTSPEINKVREMIKKVADTDSTVLILGESGTGKELVARELHRQSSRYNKPFIPINCGAIPEDLLESELFGYEKGAFTGAIATRIGRFEAADTGTVFLDEIGDMSMGLQVKILRVLQEREFERIGGQDTIKVDIRVLAATNQDLEKAVIEKKFREDLFYRLNVIPISLPPLRGRGDDVQLLSRYFLDALATRKNKAAISIAPDAMAALTEYAWPGNVREMVNIMERLIVLDETGTISLEDLPSSITKTKFAQPLGSSAVLMPSDGLDFNQAVDDFERRLISSALQRADGVKKKAADFLNLNRTTLIEKMKRKGLLG
jgi:DNA-binding NtrC family response regulator